MQQKKLPTLPSQPIEQQLRKQGCCLLVGTDEVGRGPLAGPVVAACVLLPEGCDSEPFKDSKKLSPARREQLSSWLLSAPGVVCTFGLVEAAEIDRVNILQASLLAMKQAVLALPFTPGYLLVDGRFRVPLDIPQQALVRGESRSPSIAAASIVAKVRRDELMLGLDQQYPQYKFSQHKGYGTAEHLRLLEEYGPCPEHRQSFNPLKDWLAQGRYAGKVRP